MLYVYILYSEANDRIYIGHTDNLEARLDRHNRGMVRSTKAYSPWNLIHSEDFSSRGEAMKREKVLKSHKGRDFIRKNMLKWQGPADDGLSAID